MLSEKLVEKKACRVYSRHIFPRKKAEPAFGKRLSNDSVGHHIVADAYIIRK